MIIRHAHKVRPVERLAKVAAILDTVKESQLREWVEHIAEPRHYVAEPEQNRATADWLAQVFAAWGFRVERQGEFSNIVALPKGGLEQVILVGAHYDSVPMCPGADDNVNSNYHRQSDTPNSLNYHFLKQVCQLLTACVLLQAAEPEA